MQGTVHLSSITDNAEATSRREAAIVAQGKQGAALGFELKNEFSSRRAATKPPHVRSLSR